MILYNLTCVHNFFKQIAVPTVSKPTSKIMDIDLATVSYVKNSLNNNILS